LKNQRVFSASEKIEKKVKVRREGGMEKELLKMWSKNLSNE